MFAIAAGAPCASAASAADRYWVGPSSATGSWSDPTNWSATPGGPGGAGVPALGDHARFFTSATRTVEFDHAYASPGINLTLVPSPPFPGSDANELRIVHSAPASRLVVAGNMVMNADAMAETRYTQSDGVLDVTGVLDVRRADTVHRSRFTLSGGTLTAGSENVDGDFTQTGGHHVVAGRVFIGGVTDLSGPSRPVYADGTLGAGSIHIAHGNATFGGAAVTAQRVLVESQMFNRPNLVYLTAGSINAESVELRSMGTFTQSGGALDVSEYRNAGGDTFINGGSITVGTLAVSGSRFRLGSGGDKLLRTGAIQVTGGSLDLTNNAALVDYTGASPLLSIRAQIASGHNGGFWNGFGILSTSASSTHGIAYAEASEVAVVPPVFGNVDSTTVLIRYARYGDADWNGLVNLDDFNRLAQNFGQSNRVWTDADFNYDGIINLVDFNRLAANFGLSAAGPGVTPQDWARLGGAIPEPAPIGLIGAVASAGALISRGRRA